MAHKLVLKVQRWAAATSLFTLPQLPVFAPQLPVPIGNRWHPFAKNVPRTVRWPANFARSMVWLGWCFAGPFTRIPLLGRLVWWGFNLGALIQLAWAVVVVSLAYTFITLPTLIVGGACRAVLWVMLVRRGWTPPLEPGVEQSLWKLDRELDEHMAQAYADHVVDSVTSHTNPSGDAVLHEVEVSYSPPTRPAQHARQRRGLSLQASIAAVAIAAAVVYTIPRLPSPPDTPADQVDVAEQLATVSD